MSGFPESGPTSENLPAPREGRPSHEREGPGARPQGKLRRDWKVVTPPGPVAGAAVLPSMTLQTATTAAMNKSLARSNKSRTVSKATKRRNNSGVGQAALMSQPWKVGESSNQTLIERILRWLSSL